MNLKNDIKEMIDSFRILLFGFIVSVIFFGLGLLALNILPNNAFLAVIVVIIVSMVLVFFGLCALVSVIAMSSTVISGSFYLIVELLHRVFAK
jgi:asparagine N-glycosylation enzyme membrane subunit Stt3